MRQEQQQIQRKTRRKRRVFIRPAMRGAEAAFSKLRSEVARQSRLVKMHEFSPGEFHHLPNVLPAPRFAAAALLVPLHTVEANGTSELLESDPRRA